MPAVVLGATEHTAGSGSSGTPPAVESASGGNCARPRCAACCCGEGLHCTEQSRNRYGGGYFWHGEQHPLPSRFSNAAIQIQPKLEVLPDEAVDAILSSLTAQLKAALQALPTSQQKGAVERLLRFLSITLADARFAARFREKYAAGIALPADPQLDVPETLRGLIGAPK